MSLASRRYLVRFIAKADELAELRTRLGELLAVASPALRSDVLISVNEAVSNSLIHACCGSKVSVHVAVDATQVTVTVVDRGQGFDIVGLAGSWPPALEATSGRGIFLLAMLMDTVTVDTDGGTIVHMSRRLRGAGHRGCSLSTVWSPTRARFHAVH